MTANLTPQNLMSGEARTANRAFAIGGFLCSAESLGVAESFVLRINISGENPTHRKSAKRIAQLKRRHYGQLTRQ